MNRLVLCLVLCFMAALGMAQTTTVIANKVVVKDNLSISGYQITGILNDTTLTAASGQNVPTSRAVKGYVDAALAGGGGDVELRPGPPDTLCVGGDCVVIYPSGGGGSLPQLSTPSVSARAISTTEISIAWTPVSGADKYILERSTTSGFSTSYVAYEGGLTYWVNRGLAENTIYYYRVRAEGFGYETGNNSSVVFDTTFVSFNPDLSGQVLFWDITDTTTVVVSGSLAEVEDQGTGGNDVIISSNRPAYFSVGGPRNLPYIRTTSTNKIGVTPFSVTASPFTLYAVIRLNDFSSFAYSVMEYDTLPLLGQTPSNGLKIRLDYSGVRNVDARGYIQSGVTPYYGAVVPALYREDWMVVKIVIKDNNSYWIEINDEPIQPPYDASGSTAMAITRLIFSNCDLAQVRGFNRMITADEDRKMKAYLVDHFGIAKPKLAGIYFGDSNTLGAGNTPKTYGGYATIVHDNSPLVAYNYAISGTRINSLDTFSTKYAKPEFAYNWVIVQYGTNDANQGGGQDWESWKLNYKRYLQRFIDAGFDRRKMVLLTMPYTSLTSYVGDAGGYVVAKTREVANELGINLVDWYKTMQENGYDVATEPSNDGIHPGTNGHLTAGYGVLNILRRATEKGLVAPQMDSIARLAIVNPAVGAMVVDTSYNAIYFYDGDTWAEIGSSSGGGGGGGAYLPITGGTLTGTGGAGAIYFPAQSGDPSTPPSGVAIFANAAGILTWRQSNGMIQSFIRTATTGNRTYTLQDNNGIIPLQSSALTQYRLPVVGSGGILEDNAVLGYLPNTLSLTGFSTAMQAGYSSMGALASSEYGSVGTNYRNNGSGPVRVFADGGSALGFGAGAGNMAMRFQLWQTGAANSAITTRNTVLFNTANAANTYMNWGFNLSAAPIANYQFKGGGATGLHLILENSASTRLLTVFNSGEFGFGGVTNPLAPVHVGGEAIVTSTIWFDAAKTYGIFRGSGSPEGVVTAAISSVYHRTDGGTGTSFYVKESGSGNTGWVAK